MARITVVVRCYGEAAPLARCLESLAKQTVRQELEAILTGDSTGKIAAGYPFVTVLDSPGRWSMPELLKQALEQAQGDVVVVTDSRCHFPPDWLEKLWRAQEGRFPVVGGAVEHSDPQTLLGWATYFADYGSFMLPAVCAETFLLAGNHVSYRRGLIRDASGAMTGGYWKVFFHWDLERRGVHSLFDPDLVIFRSQVESFRDFALQYYRNGRDFAASRSRRMSKRARFGHILSAPALPVLLLYRRLLAVWGKKRERWRLLLSIPLLAVFVLCWSAGEFAGYVGLRPHT